MRLFTVALLIGIIGFIGCSKPDVPKGEPIQSKPAPVSPKMKGKGAVEVDEAPGPAK